MGNMVAWIEFDAEHAGKLGVLGGRRVVVASRRRSSTAVTYRSPIATAGTALPMWRVGRTNRIVTRHSGDPARPDQDVGELGRELVHQVEGAFGAALGRTT